ncbi:cytochrome P450 [Aspergillus steynii IBT 23096]|uniref:Cytochrome P450 n=1 Tax=Aspergillus steynii IBT 23096 TaxID=1392250 RepID=A0A2I2GPT0_9EURO|nr:cytochrome P450 [Aspergillus steynii IBT 23096]PLB54882.1 cytochrome P450 [Aspergillus steynii IBT 23096]
MILEVLAALSLAYLGWSMVSMEINYRRASSMGIPLVRLPIDPNNLVWMVLESQLWPILDRLPIDLGSLSRYGRRGWHFADKANSHLQYGSIWALVTPVDIYVHVADANTVHDIFDRRSDFLRPSKMYKLLEVYGPCISTASWKDWPRHRKVLATPFNESIMTFVWDESVKQTRQMLSTWTDASSPAIESVARDTRTLSLNVLAATGFRRSYEFMGANKNPVSSTTTTRQAEMATKTPSSYRDALQTVLDNCIMLMIMPQRVLSLPFAPASWRRVAKAASSFKVHMARMLDEEIDALKAGKSGSGGIMTSFVRAMDLKQHEDAKGGSVKGLSLDEIFGNIFVINFAGHDTTANTLAFATLLLAAHPDVQEWVAEELAEVMAGADTEGGYDALFSKLKRSKAIMLETLRLYPPIMALPKWTNDQPQSLQVGEQTIVIPPNTGVMPGVLALHTHPAYWEDPLAWKPRRWISTNNDESDALSPGDEVLLTPPKCTYIPWSDGPQNCPGTRFSQVEFVAVMASLLRHHRIEIVGAAGESLEDARRRVLDTVNDVDQEMLLRMKDADRVRLVCRRA